MRAVMRVAPTLPVLLASAVLLVACGQNSLDRKDVVAFIDEADNAARKRFAPEICELRGKDFKLRVIFHTAHAPSRPSELELGRKLFCIEAAKFSRLRQYSLERQSLTVELAPDRKSARVTANYIETMPYYEPGMLPSTPDDFQEFQVLKTRDDSTVGIEDGDIVFLSTNSESFQTLVGKGAISLPYD